MEQLHRKQLPRHLLLILSPHSNHSRRCGELRERNDPRRELQHDFVPLFLGESVDAVEIIETVARNGDVATLPAVQLAAAHAAERHEGGNVDRVGELGEAVDRRHELLHQREELRGASRRKPRKIDLLVDSAVDGGREVGDTDGFGQMNGQQIVFGLDELHAGQRRLLISRKSKQNLKDEHHINHIRAAKHQHALVC